MAQQWKVIGGKVQGGIVVREGRSVFSKECSERLSHGAIVDEVTHTDGRLEYNLSKGQGPPTGWVSTTFRDKAILSKIVPKVETVAPAPIPEKAKPAVPRMSQDYQRSEECMKRCQAEIKRKVKAWETISITQVMENHDKKAQGMFYDMIFPWSEKLLIQMGPTWLTKAFHAAGTLSKSNSVTKIIPEKKVKVTTGNNGGKFLFEVEYAVQEEGLHTKLFAKIPHAYEGATQSDRLSSSVNKQPMELYELNANRLLEATLPVKIPKYYFGDISNETSNWILITEQIPFADWEPLDFEGKFVGKRRASLAPYMIEGPYDKCMDWCLRGSPIEYYMALVRAGARMAGLHKAGKMGDPIALASQFEDMSNRPAEVFGMKQECTGQPPAQLKAKINLAIKFLAEDGKVLYPSFTQDKAFQTKFYDTLMLQNGYMTESVYWRHSDQDYISLTHNNLNVDNAFFWRDEQGDLDLGVLDWGSMGQRSLGFKLWWWLYCCEFEPMTEGMDGFLQCFVDNYAEYGGPILDKEVLRLQFLMTAIEQMFGLISAIPQIFRMCSKKEWPSIQNRYDRRVGENIDGKSALRLYLQVMNTVCNMMWDPQWRGAEKIEQWAEEFSKQMGKPKKEKSAIFP